MIDVGKITFDFALNRHIVHTVTTMVNTPSSVSTVSYWRLVADTSHTVQPDWSGAYSIPVSNVPSSVPDKKYNQSTSTQCLHVPETQQSR